MWPQGNPLTLDTGSHGSTGSEVFFPGAAWDGVSPPDLQGRLQVPEGAGPFPGAVLLHANPRAGGNMDMGVVSAVEQALVKRGVAVLRYNSRGIGRSGGEVSGMGNRRLIAPEGGPETADIGAALDFLASQDRVDGGTLALVGHSFGARIALAYLNLVPRDERVQGVACIGLAVGWGDLSHLGQWAGPKLFVTGDRDDFCPPADLDRFVAGLPAPAKQVVLKDTGHFFEGREADLAAVIAGFMDGVLVQRTLA